MIMIKKNHLSRDTHISFSIRQVYKCTITLEDDHMLLGLNINGEPITGKTEVGWEIVEPTGKTEYLSSLSLVCFYLLLFVFLMYICCQKKTKNEEKIIIQSRHSNGGNEKKN